MCKHPNSAKMEQQKSTLLIHQWNFCRLDCRGSVYILTLTGEGHHLLEPSSLNDILAALTVVEQSPDAGALVTTNEGRYFSNGFELKWVQRNPSIFSRTLLLGKLEDVLYSLTKLGIPTIAALCGHASAGGFILALAHDYRFMTDGRAVLYMSELDVGIHMPRSTMTIIRNKLPPTALREVVMKARKFTASEAVGLGVIDGFYENTAKTFEAAVVEAERLARSKWKRESYANLRDRTCPGMIEELEARRDPFIWLNGSKM